MIGYSERLIFIVASLAALDSIQHWLGVYLWLCGAHTNLFWRRRESLLAAHVGVLQARHFAFIETGEGQSLLF